MLSLSEAIRIRLILLLTLRPAKRIRFRPPVIGRSAKTDLRLGQHQSEYHRQISSPSPHPTLPRDQRKLIVRIHTPQVNPEVLLRSVSKIAAASYTDQS